MFLLAKKANPIASDQWWLILAGVGAAFCGVLIGRRYLHKITMNAVQTVTGMLLLGIALALGVGVV
jgi:hypothetical protein